MVNFEAERQGAKPNELLLQELILRRQEANSALSNLYLRGTVLLAVAITEIGFSTSFRIFSWLTIAVHGSLILASLLGLVSFWPQKTQKFTIEFMNSFMKKPGQNAPDAYRRYLESDYLEVEKAVTSRTRYVKVGFMLCLGSLIVTIFISNGWVS